ncbi:MAG: cob(I)yrinic acid a,c-diamide adenosyltransferase [Leptospiraceae bacterium]|nr:cob(I)yrinic acid a,c-diamide adenosyltransferase [Leptospiraceae bacterium]
MGKIYTKTGDKGSTSLANGKRVSKADNRVEMYGDCDELNSSLGIVINYIIDEPTLNVLQTIQVLLFELGSELAGFKADESVPSIILEEDILELETEMDRMSSILPPLKTFILPGGSEASSFLHLSRTICRRLERKMVSFNEKVEEIGENSLKFVNRLSDYLFMLARYANYIEKKEDVKWFSRAKGKNKQ